VQELSVVTFIGRQVDNLSAWERYDLETMIQNEHKLYADAHERWKFAEARVRELEQRIKQLEAELVKK
jgi:hypothetical protein